MSIDLDWPTLTTGSSGTALAESIEDFLHQRFQTVQLPRFIRSVEVHSFEFGDEAPEIEIKDICDPWEEFYEDDDEGDDREDEDGEVEENQRGGGRDGVKAMMPPPSTTTTAKFAHNIPTTPSSTSGTTTATVPRPNPAKPSFINLHLPNLREPTIPTPFLSRTPTPATSITGGAANFSYFHHLPLAGGLSGTSTPLPFTAGWGENVQRQHHQNPISYTYDDVSSPPQPSASKSNPLHQHQQPPPSPKAQEGDRSLDVQTHLHISYSGSLSLSLTAEILLDYPMPSFVGIPLKLQIIGCSFDGTAIIAYLHSQSHSPFSPSPSPSPSGLPVPENERKATVHFCFLDESSLDDKSNEGKTSAGGLLKEIRVESEIGRKESGKQSLKNVGKVERFVLEQVRRIFDEEFVWPSFITLLV